MKSQNKYPPILLHHLANFYPYAWDNLYGQYILLLFESTGGSRWWDIYNDVGVAIALSKGSLCLSY
jgi:hypothetical protein